MSRTVPWQDGRRAWNRLNGWHQPGSGTGNQDPADAITRLADVHLVRSLLDRAEFNLVKAARADGKSWSEISSVLHITRESAEARWSDLDAPS
jgi:hypothetical protein